MLTLKSLYLTLLGVALATLLALMLSISSTNAGFTAKIVNDSNMLRTGTSFGTATNAGTQQCSSAPVNGVVSNVNSFPCVGSIFPNVPVTGTASSTTTLTNTGTQAFPSASFKANSCLPVKLDNRSTSANPMLVRGNVGFNQAGPNTLTGSKSLLFNGSDTLAANVAASASLANFTVGVWFKTTSNTGTLFGFSDSPSQAPATSKYDRHLYMTSTGRLAFSTNILGAKTATSTNAYNDGNWHYAYVIGQSNINLLGLTSNITLFVDGVQAATSTYALTSVSDSYNGYWRIGQGQTNMGYPGNGQYFNGSLSNFTVFPSILNTTQMGTLYNAGTQATYESRAAALGSTSLFTLGDTGTETYSGALPNSAANPCSHVRATVNIAASCVYPSNPSPCAVPASGTSLAGLVSAPAASVQGLAPAAPQTMLVTLERDTAYNVNYNVGLHLITSVTLTENGFNQAFTWAANRTII